MRLRRPLALSATGLALAAVAVAAPSHADNARISVQPGLVATSDTKLVSVTRTKEVFHDDEELVFYGLRGVAGPCAILGVDIDGVEEDRTNVTFPITIGISRRQPNYPRAEGVHTITLKGKSGNCTGLVSTTFHTAKTPKAPALPPTGATAPNGSGLVTAFQVAGFTSTQTKGSLVIRGNGVCRMHADIMDLNRPNAAANPVFMKVFDPGAHLPVVIDDLGPLPNGSYRAYLIGYDDAKCKPQGPDAHAGGWYVDFKVGTGQSTQQPSSTQGGNQNGGGGGGTPPQGGGGGGGSLPSNKPATGAISALSVPGGSFAEDDPQKLQVNGQGGCAMNLQLTNKSYGGSFDQTYPVNPVKLDTGATLYNGTHFGTLAEGSYHAQATGTGGCTGTAGIDFKVTAKTSTKKVPGKPVVSFDQQPKSGGVFTNSKDSNIWFKVTVPQAVKDEPYASCCDVELDYKNEYGGWEPLPNSPFSDSGYGLAVTQQAGVVNKSVSYFSNATQWRIKVRAYKFKTEFDWSDWVEFKVDQH
jgi:hypothetical protein